MIRAINITPLGVATQLVVTSQPPEIIGAAESFGLVVCAEDSFGTADSTFNGSITLALANGSVRQAFSARLQPELSMAWFTFCLDPK